MPTCAPHANIWRGEGKERRALPLELKQNKEGFGCGSHALRREPPNFEQSPKAWNATGFTHHRCFPESKSPI